MSFQKCPICNGTGFDPTKLGLVPCTVCKGTKIINELTGKPPYVEETTTSNLTNNNFLKKY